MTPLGTGFDTLVVVLGFLSIIWLHELGHFLAAKWAGIRVLGFAIGFGPALVSFRKGFGLQAGSSDGRYQTLLVGAKGNLSHPSLVGISPTEYRWNALPLGGYVKMLGQEDGNPEATSDSPDSYQMSPPWKRMIVISAGVIMNIVSAAILLVVVFTIGLKVEPAVVGQVQIGSPAARALATNAAELGVTQAGLRPGDKLLSIDGAVVDSFKDVVVAIAMAERSRAMNFVVERAGLDRPLVFGIVPEVSRENKLLSVGIGPAASGTIGKDRDPEINARLAVVLNSVGAIGVQAGATLETVGGRPASGAFALDVAARESGGQNFEAVFKNPDAASTAVMLTPVPDMQEARFEVKLVDGMAEMPVEHLLGLLPLMKVVSVVEKSGAGSGLMAGDVFARIGDTQWPSVIEGTAEVHRHAGRTVAIEVLRRSGDGVDASVERVKLDAVPVSRKGLIGFVRSTTLNDSLTVARWPESSRFPRVSPKTTAKVESGESVVAAAIPAPASPAMAGPALAGMVVAGSTITAVNGQPVTTFPQSRAAIMGTAGGDGPVVVSLRLPALAGEANASSQATDVVTVSLDAAQRKTLAQLGWSSPVPAELFAPQQVLMRGTGLVDSLNKGLKETKNTMVQTYLTLVRLFQGSVRVEHLKGPIGIAHMGTILAERGFVWLLFFMAVISLNVAVVNFLPLPIVDGGHFCFLVYEWITGRPVSVVFQNVTTLAGLVMIGTMFLIVTYNDIVNLFGL